MKKSDLYTEISPQERRKRSITLKRTTSVKLLSDSSVTFILPRGTKVFLTDEVVNYKRVWIVTKPKKGQENLQGKYFIRIKAWRSKGDRL